MPNVVFQLGNWSVLTDSSQTHACDKKTWVQGIPQSIAIPASKLNAWFSTPMGNACQSSKSWYRNRSYQLSKLRQTLQAAYADEAETAARYEASDTKTLM